MTKSTFIIAASGSISGVVANVKNVALNDAIAVKKADDMAALSLDTLTAIYNNATGKTVGKFKIGKAAACEKVMAALEAMDVSKLIQLDKQEQAKVDTQAKTVAAGTGERKVRDSKLQRMAAAFREEKDGVYSQWTIKQLMEKCGTTEKITHQYISILRAQNDRFRMNIVKDKEAKTFQFQPKPQRKAPAVQAVQQAAA
jgi:uncharacterized beta-barrel protein YwiB (DUF1934 family)